MSSHNTSWKTKLLDASCRIKGLLKLGHIFGLRQMI